MKKIILFFIATTMPGMDLKKEFYEALTLPDHQKALALLEQDKTLVHADFADYNKSKDDDSGDNDTPLLASIRENKFCPVVFYSLLEAGADIDNRYTPKRQTPLLKAIFLRQSDIAHALLARNANTYRTIPIMNKFSLDARSLAYKMNIPQVVETIDELRKYKQPSRLIADASKQLAKAQPK